MIKALVLDVRTNFVSNIVLGALTLVGLAAAATLSTWFFAYIFAALWIASCVSSHRNVAATFGRLGALQCVLGVTRREAVRAKYVVLALVAVFVLAVALLGVLAGGGVAAVSVPIFVALVAGVVCVSAVNLTLGYTASRGAQQAVTIVFAATLGALALTPGVFGLPEPGSNYALSTILWSPPLPLGWVLVTLAPVALVVGERLAQRAYAQVTL